ncbi:CbtA family protein [Affinirhizobium pseudoryzae]|uniref:CbtA family protein n=1 Tax=Allorhizobium pseudoryzae TaxID=379684 RepID=UPI001F40AC23|nr:CbtA family protein [Allorhizobium pseudoryzae]
MFRSIVFSAVIAGIASGMAVSLLQMAGTTPLIIAAEAYETAEPAAAEPAAAPHTHAPGTAAHEHAHDHAAPVATSAHSHDAGHDHGDGWAPADGIERTAYTMAANILTAIGYALVLSAALSIARQTGATDKSGWRTGLAFGLAGFASVMLAPMLGLPPELPGSPAAELGARQTWWIATALATAAGIALLAFRREPIAAVFAVLLIAAPHVVGAPLPPEGEHPLAPLSLERQFIVAATVTSFLFWALVGSLSGALLQRFERGAAPAR